MKTILDTGKNTIDKDRGWRGHRAAFFLVKSWWKMPSTRVPTAVTVEIKDGGTTLVRITDNGEGIAPSEVKKAFMRHATSKVTKAEDLFGIHFPGIPWRGSFQYCGGLPGGAYYQDGRRADRCSLCY